MGLAGSIPTVFWAQVNKNGPIHPVCGQCWEWTGGLYSQGYGQFNALGENRSHRVAYRLFIGTIPDGLFVLHKCDNPKCVNPKHLFTGTHQDNMDDRNQKGRQAKGDRNGVRLNPQIVQGENNGHARLTEVKVLEIRSRFKSCDKKDGKVALGLEFGVSANYIGKILRRKVWRHI